MSVTALPVSLAFLRQALTSEHYPKLFAGRDTHDAARDLIAQLIAHTEDVRLLTEIVQSGLPDNYAGNTLDEIPAMVSGAQRKGFQHREILPRSKKKTIAARALGLIFREDIELFHDSNRRPFISIRKENGGLSNLSLQSREAEHWIRGLYFATFAEALPSQSVSEVVATLAANALYKGRKQPIAVRIGRDGEAIYIDLGRNDALVVRIDAQGWTLTYTTAVKYWRPAGFRELPKPTIGGDITCIQRLLQLEDRTWALVLAFLINTLRPNGPYFCLLIDGEQGSGKSVLCALVKNIIDPSAIDKLPLPSSDEQLMIQAKDSHVLVFDNASSMKNDISDALCRLATGGAIAKRRLYTDDDLHILQQCSPFIINGIGEFAHRPDLLERSILLSLPSMPDGARKTEKQIFEDFNALLPGFLGCLYDVVCVALRNEGKIESPKNIRMADAAAWLRAAEPGTGLQDGTLLAAIEESQLNSVVDRTREHPLVLAIEFIIKDASYEGGVGDLHDLLMLRQDRPDRSFPRTPAHLSNQLQRLKPAMAKIGIFVKFERKTRKGRTVKIWQEGQEGMLPGKPDRIPLFR